MYISYVQGDQLNMAVFFWYLEKSDFYSVQPKSGVHRISHFIQVNRKLVLNGPPVNNIKGTASTEKFSEVYLRY